MQEKLNRLLKNRGGAVLAGVLAALVAVILLVVYLHSYRSSVDSGKRPVRVLVATKLIPRGTSATLIAQQGLYQVTTVDKDQLQLQAILDPAAIQDRVAATDILPGQQLTQADFTTESPQSIPYEISGAQRAIAVPIDSAHGLIGQVAAGNFVDIYVGVSGATAGSLVKLLASNVYVLVAPGAGSANAILRINTQDAAKFAFAIDNEKLWFILRPQVGAKPTPPETATLATILAKATTGG